MQDRRRNRNGSTVGPHTPLDAKAGVSECWLVDPIGQTLEEYFLVVGQDPLPGYDGRVGVARSGLFEVVVPVDGAFSLITG